MDLEELKVIWDAHNRVPLFTLKETNLHAMIHRRIQKSRRTSACRYRAEIGLSLLGGFVTLVAASLLAFGLPSWLAQWHWPKAPRSTWELVTLFAASGVWFYFAEYLNLARQRLQRCGETFESSLRGDIDRALARVEFQMNIARGVVWQGFVPVYVALTLSMLVLVRLSIAPGRISVLHASEVVITAVMIAAFWTEVNCRRNAIRNQYEPQRHELESLRQKLAEPQR